MAEYYNPDGTGPYFTDPDGVIPSGATVVSTGTDGNTGTDVDGTVLTAIRVSSGVLQVRTRNFTNGMIDGAESDWVSIYTHT